MRGDAQKRALLNSRKDKGPADIQALGKNGPFWAMYDHFVEKTSAFGRAFVVTGTICLSRVMDTSAFSQFSKVTDLAELNRLSYSPEIVLWVFPGEREFKLSSVIHFYATVSFKAKKS